MDLPLNGKQARQLCRWLKDNYGNDIVSALNDTPFSVDVACAIACQETGIYLYGFLGEMPADKALGLCVFDASGDYPGTSRKAFPKNTVAFREAYGDALTNMLIAEANLCRSARHYPPKDWLYKGYGLFQYDLQNIKSNERFFREKLWYQFDECLARLKDELLRKYKATGDVMSAIRGYNGSGSKADQYLENVKQFIEFSKEC